MADEIKISVSMQFAKGGLSDAMRLVGLDFDMAGDDYVRNVQTIGTADEALDLGDITTPGYILIRNLDPTNFVEIRPADDGADTIRLEAGGMAMFKFGSDATAPFLIADTAACRVEYLLIEA